MSKSQTATNPFYVGLVVVGILFAITACAYCVMAYRAIQRPGLHAVTTMATGSADKTGLLAILDRHGMALMGVELALLAVCTFGAMAYDKRIAAAVPGTRASDALDQRAASDG